MSNRIKLKGTSERSFDIGLTDKFTLDASGFTANHTWVLPDSDGSSGYVLSTNGSGTLSWSAIGAAAEQTPQTLLSSETFTVNTNRQVLFAMDIVVEGDLVVDGYLVEVSTGNYIFA